MTDEARNPELEARIVANPEDDAAYAIYADWLQERGEPRGELIALQLAGKDAQAKKLIAAHEDALLGPLAAHAVCHDGSDKPAFAWERGFIHAARFAYDSYAEKMEERFADVLEMFLAHPSARFLTEIIFNTNGEWTEETLDDLFIVFGREPRATVRSIAESEAKELVRDMSYEVLVGVPGSQKLPSNIPFARARKVASR